MHHWFFRKIIPLHLCIQERIASYISPTLQKMIDQHMRWCELKYDVVPEDTRIAQIAHDAFCRIKAASGLVDIAFTLIGSREPTAFCVGSHVYITTSFIQEFLLQANERSLIADELAGIIAHEVSHFYIHMRHAERSVHERSTDVPDILTELKEELAPQRIMSFAYEYEADRLALRWMDQAGFNPNAYVDALRSLLAHEHSEKKDNMPTIVKTHPPTNRRIFQCRNHLARSYFLHADDVPTLLTLHKKDLKPLTAVFGHEALETHLGSAVHAGRKLLGVDEKRTDKTYGPFERTVERHMWGGFNHPGMKEFEKVLGSVTTFEDYQRLCESFLPVLFGGTCAVDIAYDHVRTFPHGTKKDPTIDLERYIDNAENYLGPLIDQYFGMSYRAAVRSSTGKPVLFEFKGNYENGYKPLSVFTNADSFLSQRSFSSSKEFKNTVLSELNDDEEAPNISNEEKRTWEKVIAQFFTEVEQRWNKVLAIGVDRFYAQGTPEDKLKFIVLCASAMPPYQCQELIREVRALKLEQGSVDFPLAPLIALDRILNEDGLSTQVEAYREQLLLALTAAPKDHKNKNRAGTQAAIPTGRSFEELTRTDCSSFSEFSERVSHIDASRFNNGASVERAVEKNFSDNILTLQLEEILSPVSSEHAEIFLFLLFGGQYLAPRFEPPKSFADLFEEQDMSIQTIFEELVQTLGFINEEDLAGEYSAYIKKLLRLNSVALKKVFLMIPPERKKWLNKLLPKIEPKNLVMLLAHEKRVVEIAKKKIHFRTTPQSLSEPAGSLDDQYERFVDEQDRTIIDFCKHGYALATQEGRFNNLSVEEELALMLRIFPFSCSWRDKYLLKHFDGRDLERKPLIALIHALTVPSARISLAERHFKEKHGQEETIEGSLNEIERWYPDFSLERDDKLDALAQKNRITLRLAERVEDLFTENAVLDPSKHIQFRSTSLELLRDILEVALPKQKIEIGLWLLGIGAEPETFFRWRVDNNIGLQEVTLNDQNISRNELLLFWEEYFVGQNGIFVRASQECQDSFVEKLFYAVFPLKEMEYSPESLKKLFLLYKNIVKYLPVEKKVSVLTRFLVKGREQASFEDTIKEFFEALGFLGIKAAQYLVSQTDLLDDKLLATLSRLTDQAPPFKKSAAFRVWGMDNSGKTIGPLLGSASMRQSYIVEGPAGPRVVKFLRPNLLSELNESYRVLTELVSVINRNKDLFGITLPDNMPENIYQQALKELDLVAEKQAQELIAQNIRERWKKTTKNAPHLITPSIDVVQPRFLEETYMEGSLPFEEGLRQLSAADQHALRKGLVLEILTQIFDDGIYHADPHKGNILLSGKTAVLIDFGLVGTLSPENRDLFYSVLQAFMGKDRGTVMKVLVLLHQATPEIRRRPIDKAVITREVEHMFEALLSSSLSLNDIVSILLASFNHLGIALPEELYILSKTMSTLNYLIGDSAEISTAVLEFLLKHLDSTVPSLNLPDMAAVNAYLEQPRTTESSGPAKAQDLPSGAFIRKTSNIKKVFTLQCPLQQGEKMMAFHTIAEDGCKFGFDIAKDLALFEVSVDQKNWVSAELYFGQANTKKDSSALEETWRMPTLQKGTRWRSAGSEVDQPLKTTLTLNNTTVFETGALVKDCRKTIEVLWRGKWVLLDDLQLYDPAIHQTN